MASYNSDVFFSLVAVYLRDGCESIEEAELHHLADALKANRNYAAQDVSAAAKLCRRSASLSSSKRRSSSTP